MRLAFGLRFGLDLLQRALLLDAKLFQGWIVVDEILRNRPRRIGGDLARGLARRRRLAPRATSAPCYRQSGAVRSRCCRRRRRATAPLRVSEAKALVYGARKRIATLANSRRVAARMRSPARSRAICTKTPDVARALATTPQDEAACRRRKKVEMLFAHLKRILRLGSLRLRGPCGAKDEFLLAATAQKSRRLARLRPARAAMGATAA